MPSVSLDAVDLGRGKIYQDCFERETENKPTRKVCQHTKTQNRPNLPGLRMNSTISMKTKRSQTD